VLGASVVLFVHLNLFFAEKLTLRQEEHEAVACAMRKKDAVGV
jgi:hypothetical protein